MWYSSHVLMKKGNMATAPHPHTIVSGARRPGRRWWRARARTDEAEHDGAPAQPKVQCSRLDDGADHAVERIASCQA